MRGVFFFLICLFLPLTPAWAGGKVVEISEKYYLHENATYRVESQFTIVLDEPGPLLVDYRTCFESEGGQNFAPVTTKRFFKVGKFALNGEPVKTKRFVQQGYDDRNQYCNAIEGRQGVLRVYMENPDKIYPPGEYEFSIETTINYMFLQHAGKEFFAVFPGEWVRTKYVMEKISAELILPAKFGVKEARSMSANPDPNLVQMGEAGRKIMYSTDYKKISEGHYRFWATTPIQPGVHDFWVVVFFYQPIFSKTGFAGEGQKIDVFLERVAGRYGVGTTAVLNFILGIIIFAYFFMAWIAVEIKNWSGEKRMFFEAPFGLEPAHVKDIETGKSDVRALIATFLNMAVKGALFFTHENGNLTLHKGQNAKHLTNPERLVFEALFSYENDKIGVGTGDKAEAGIWRKAFADFTDNVTREKKLERNKLGIWLFVFGLVFSLIALGFSLQVTPWRGPNYYLLMAVYFFIVVYYGHEIYTRTNLFSKRRLISKILFWVGTIGYVLWKFFRDYFYYSSSSGFFEWEFFEMVPLIFIALVNLVFFVTIAKSYPNRDVQAKMNGYKRYLKETDVGYLAQTLPFRENIKVFEKHLPFAVALGYEKSWGKRFDLQKGDFNVAYTNRVSFSWFRISKGDATFDEVVFPGYTEVCRIFGKNLITKMTADLGGSRFLLFFS